MTSSTYQVSGLASGFDWMTMLDQLRQVEHNRIDIKSSQQSEYSAQLNQWQSVNTGLLNLKSAAEQLMDPEDFALFKTSMTSDSSAVKAGDLIAATVGTGAEPGSYTIQVTRLAAAQKISSNPFTGKTDPLGSAYSGDILINGRAITIAADDSLSEVADAINNADTGENPTGVTASIICYGASDYRLILNSDSTGAEGIGLLNGSSKNLIQQFGWKDNHAASVKNAITSGAQSDGFLAANVAIQSLLGLGTGEAATGTLAVDGETVSIDLATDTLTDIKDAVNTAMAAAGKGSRVVASVISETVDSATVYRLQIEGTRSFTDEKNILNTLGLLHHSSNPVAAADSEVSGNSMTVNGEYIGVDTKLVDIDGYISYTAGDEIQMTGTQNGGGAVNDTFSISSTTTVADLLAAVENGYATSAGDVIAFLTADGRVRVEDVAGGGSLEVVLTDNITDGALEFVDGDAAFGDGPGRQREIVAGADATVEIDGVQVTRSDNAVDDVIDGVTLNLVKADSEVTVTLRVERDIDAVESRIHQLVEAYNTIMDTIFSQFAYDTESETAGGVLFGDVTLRSVKEQLVSVITQSVWGVDSDFSSLSLLGIENVKGADGAWRLEIDDATLTGYLRTNFSDVTALFAGQGTAEGTDLSYIGKSGNTQAGEYAVHIHRAGTRGQETGGVDLNAGGAGDTLTLIQGESVAGITITADMTLKDIQNAVNTELDAEYARVVAGDAALTAGGSAVSATTVWNAVDGASLQDGDVISFTGTDRSGGNVSGSYTIDDAAADTLQGFLSAIETAFSSEVAAAIDGSGRLVLTDKFVGTSQVGVDISEPEGRGLDFGTVDVTAGAGDGSRQGRYAMGITAGDDGSGHLVLRNNGYGDAAFSISQDTSDGNYDHILYTETTNTTVTSAGTVFIDENTVFSEIYGAGAAGGDTVTLSGSDRNGNALTPATYSLTYTITDADTDTVGDLLDRIENVYADAGNTAPTSVTAFMRDGKVYVEDTTAGSSAIALTLTPNNEGGGSLQMGAFDQSTERDLDLGLINGTVTGLDVAGTINGEAATGAGRLLTGDDGNANTAGLSVHYGGSTDNVDAGTVTFTTGIAERFERALYAMTDAIDGYVTFKQDSLQDLIFRMDDEITEMEDRLNRKMDRLVQRFISMELALSELQNQSSWLVGQINSLRGFDS